MSWCSCSPPAPLSGWIASCCGSYQYYTPGPQTVMGCCNQSYTINGSNPTDYDPSTGLGYTLDTSLSELQPGSAAYNTQYANDLAKQFWMGCGPIGGAAYNSPCDTGAYQRLQALQATDPAAYYNAQLNLLGQQGGWETVDGPTHGSAAQQQQIQALIPQAEATGLTPAQIQSLVGSGYNTGVSGGNQEMANAASSSGGFASGLPQFAGAIALGALTGGALAGLCLLGDSTGLVDSAGNIIGGGVEGSASGSAPIVTTAATDAVPATTSSSFGINPSATEGIGGTGGALNASGAAATQSALGLGDAPVGLETSSIGMGGTAGAGSLAGITGSETAAGLGGTALGTGLTADQLAQYEAGATSGSSLPNLSNALKAANLAKTLLGGTSTSTGTSTPSATSTGSIGTTTPLSATAPTSITALPAGTLKGSTLTLPMENSNINVASENMPSYNPLSLQEIQNAANGGLMSLASGGSTTLPISGEVNIPIETYSAPATNPQSLQEIQSAKTGGQMVHHFVEGGGVCTPVRGPGVLHGGQASFNQAPHGLNPMSGGVAGQYNIAVLKKAEGGGVHVPDFYSEGGLKHTYVKGAGDGTSDSIPAMLANGEFVIPADVVSSLGNGDNDSGAHVLDEFLRTIREHKRKADANHLPPDSKGALGYLLEAKKKVKK